ncbi:nucleotidyltransferase family protein [Desulfobotulus sp. H1]|uniref:Nucleotidyltransferase family protein n=1 Tax=Desulfobotulus pelophilus TaxID=2823377 RepID=A0ABT3N882_9BACT|nr:nucleotidyltransferase family protein [Desulfobotulus pelophilus]MCW7753666.1 nucleotidyltransferase family protein [Desulfobotulus pelophilus]
MKAFLLAAGLGTRLQPLTHRIPKCLIPIHGRPLLGIWLDHLASCGVKEVCINTHYLADQVEAFLKKQVESDLLVHSIHESQLLGSAGTLLANRDFVPPGETFLILYADNLTNYRLSDLVTAHEVNRTKGGVLTMALFRAENPAACGIVDLDMDGRITVFEEKPINPVSNLANAGIYAADTELFSLLETCFPGCYPYDLGRHLLPAIPNRLFGFPMQGYLRDIGTPVSLETACREWPYFV